MLQLQGHKAFMAFKDKYIYSDKIRQYEGIKKKAF